MEALLPHGKIISCTQSATIHSALFKKIWNSASMLSHHSHSNLVVTDLPSCAPKFFRADSSGGGGLYSTGSLTPVVQLHSIWDNALPSLVPTLAHSSLSPLTHLRISSVGFDRCSDTGHRVGRVRVPFHAVFYILSYSQSRTAVHILAPISSTSEAQKSANITLFLYVMY